MKRLPLCVLATLSLCLASFSRETSKPTNGLHAYNPRAHALTHARVVTAPGAVIEDATVVLRDGLIESVGKNVSIPADARVWDLAGNTIYAGFIDAYTHFGMPGNLKPFIRKPAAPGASPQKKQPTPGERGATYWNPLVTPQRLADTHFGAKTADAEKLTDIGFTTVASFPGRGILRGQGSVVNLNGKSIHQAVVSPAVAQHFSLERAVSDRSSGTTNYPTSLMGSVALTRQALHDGQWRGKALKAFEANSDTMERPVENDALDALQPLLEGSQIGIWATEDETDYQRIARIAAEFELDFALLGNGYEYRKLAALKEIGATLILPLSFPKTPRVERADKSLDYSLEQLEHWELAPSNPAFLEKEEIEFCLTRHFLGNPGKEFWGAIRQAVKRGLSEETALKALTQTPAALYGLDGHLGTVEAGKIANLVVATGDLFSDDKAKISLVWVEGEPLEKEPFQEIDLEGEWTFDWSRSDSVDSVAIEKVEGKLSLKLGDEVLPIALKAREILFFSETPDDEDSQKSIIRFRAHVERDLLIGTATLPDGTVTSWSAERSKEASKEEVAKKDKKEEEASPALVFTKYPAGAYGVSERESVDTILVKNATIWTSGPDGRLENADLLIKKGKVAKISSGLKAPQKALVIDAAGKHVTPGLIDCHSHAGISKGVNEAASANSVEVRVGDVINPVDINLYRQLAGGLTTSHLLHGSANPMGGQSQVIKHRWGEDAEGFIFDGAMPTVKFALGENVKQSNKGEKYTSRYPQTRMGVEQFMLSEFRAAADYERRWASFEAGDLVMPPRKDLRSEATLEILRGKRSVHIHSYRQDEILTFARLAGKLDLDVGAFQHILEGYKVAEVLAEIGAGGSSFSDWWAYKFEVYDAIPYNGAIMHAAGVVTSFNSDDAELATRLNTEAAKAVKYGGLSEEEALKFVTLNPAIQLRADDRIGSLEVGKDADFVIWSAHPLSTYAYAEQTWVDGIKRFDRESDRLLRERDSAERIRLVQKALSVRLKELKLETKKKKPDSDPPGEPEDVAQLLDWIYHDGNRQYSCSGQEEGGHQH